MAERQKITAQTVKWILKRGGFIFFKKEMSKPGKAIATKRDHDKPKPFTRNDTKYQADENEQSACEMQSPAYRISMFGQIVRIKTPKCLIFFFHS